MLNLRLRGKELDKVDAWLVQRNFETEWSRKLQGPGTESLTVLCFVTSLFGGDLYVCQMHGLCKVFLGFTVIKSAKRITPWNNRNSHHLLKGFCAGTGWGLILIRAGRRQRQSVLWSQCNFNPQFTWYKLEICLRGLGWLFEDHSFWVVELEFEPSKGFHLSHHAVRPATELRGTSEVTESNCGHCRAGTCVRSGNSCSQNQNTN